MKLARSRAGRDEPGCGGTMGKEKWFARRWARWASLRHGWDLAGRGSARDDWREQGFMGRMAALSQRDAFTGYQASLLANHSHLGVRTGPLPIGCALSRPPSASGTALGTVPPISAGTSRRKISPIVRGG
jgi:hypothetical protein